jgi:hypothetical protein
VQQVGHWIELLSINIFPLMFFFVIFHELFQRGSTEVPNGGVFKNRIERGTRTGPFLSLASRGSWKKRNMKPARSGAHV